MRVLQITNSFYPNTGGQESVVLEISKKLVKKGHKVTVLTSDWGSEKNLKDEEKYMGIKIIRLKNNFWLSGYGYSSELKSWLKKNYKNYDLAHCHGYNRYMPEFSIKYIYKKLPLIFTPHGFNHTKKKAFFKKIHDLSVGRFLKKATICTALTPLDFKDYEKLGVKKEKIRVVPNGTDLETFKKTKRKKYFKNNLPLLLYVGRIHESKGLQYVLEAIKNLDVNFLIVGPDTGYKKELVRIIEKNKMEGRIKFAGKVSENEKLKAYFSSDIFVLFSNWEGFGIVLIEAMASGLPVITSDKGALDLLVQNNENGLKVEYPKSEKLKKSIEFLLKEKEERTRLGKESLKFAKKFDWKKIVKDYEKIYQEAIKKWNLKK